MIGMSRNIGTRLADGAHLAQSVTDILSTAKGSRVMRRSYGCNLPRLIDAPMNGETLIDLYAEAADALDLWEPRLRLLRVQVTSASAGRLALELTVETIDGPTTLTTTLEGSAA